MKRKLISLMTAVTMLASLIGAMPLAASAADVSASSIKLGDYVTMGGIKWRCVAFEKATGNVIDSTQTSQTYKDGYLPLMLADTSIGDKEFDANGNNTSGSHGRADTRTRWGSSYWGDSNIRDWLNSSASAGNVTWSCGNEPSYNNEVGFLWRFSAAEKAAMQTVTQKSLLAEADKNVPGADGWADYIYRTDIADVVQNYGAAYSEQVTDTMFLLDVQQVYNVYRNLDDYYKLSSVYWLRSPDGACDIRVIDRDGDVEGSAFYYYSWGHPHVIKRSVRPAFFLNPSAKFVCGDGTSAVPYCISHITITGKDENEHYTHCTNCKEELSRGKHTYTTDNSKHTCSDCGYSENHTYNENNTCTVCKHACSHSSEMQYKTATEHYKVCVYCKLKTDTAPHKYIYTGNKFYHFCEECHYDQSHSFGAYVVVSQPTSTEDGVKKRTCSICGYEDSVTFTKADHSQPHNICCDDTCTEHAAISWRIVFTGDDLVSVTNKFNQCMVPAFTLSKVWEFPDFVASLSGDNKNKVYNCLYGNRLTLENGAYIHIQSGQTYSLTDCYEGVGDIVGGTNGVIKIDKGGTFSLFEGTIKENSGTGIIENSGTMNLYGGTITGNTGAAIINNGTLNIYGGIITGNTGAAIINNGTVNIYDGTITNNAGGGIIGTGTINFKEGNPVITNNTVDGAICNVKGAETISATALGENASVGFTPAETVTAGSPVDISANGGEYYSRFVSDSGDYAIIQNGNGIQLIAAHSVLEHHAAVAATCTEGGNDEYWSCVDCNRLYSDKDGNTEIYSVPETEATGHSITHHEEKAATCTESGMGEYWECTACGTLFSDENGETEIAEIPTIDATGHRLTPHEAAEPTCTESGNSAYWECMGCDKLFSDENGTTEISAIPTIAAKGHTWGDWETTKPATEIEDGENSRTCSACSERETQVIPATGTGDTEKFSIRYEGGNAIVNAPKAGTYTVLFAAYNGSGRLTSLSAQTVTVEKGETPVTPINFTASGTVKVMLWESMFSMKPLCTADEQVSLAEQLVHSYNYFKGRFAYMAGRPL